MYIFAAAVCSLYGLLAVGEVIYYQVTCLVCIQN